MTLKKEMATLRVKRPEKLVKGKWEYRTEEFEVEVMARVKRYAMVRRKGAVPFVVSEVDLIPGKFPTA